MPADSRKAKFSANRVRLDEHLFDDSEMEALRWKRENGLANCAECRRLRLKCDRKVPCQSCERRGCTDLCPHGSRRTGEGTRFVIAATEPLHRRIDCLSRRILELEGALRSLHSQNSTDEHPLLQASSGRSKKGEQPESRSDRRRSGRVLELTDAVGTLSISDHGISRFFGVTGGPELLLSSQQTSNNIPKLHPRSDATRLLIDSVLRGRPPFSRSFPLKFDPSRYSDRRKYIESYIPPYNFTCSICDSYTEQVAPLTPIVSRIQLCEMLPAIYRTIDSTSPLFNLSKGDEIYSDPHVLALLFIVFALGSLVKFHPSTEFAEHFCQLSYAAILLKPVLENPSLATIQTLTLTATYMGMTESDLRNDLERAGSLRHMAAHLAQSIGLHRDNSNWDFAQNIAERRRTIFWHLFSSHLWEHFRQGRPIFLSLSFIDCEFPRFADDSKQLSAFFGFSADVLHNIISQMFNVDIPSYDTVMHLDKIVRNYAADDGKNKDGTIDYQVKFMWSSMKSVALMYIHLGFFAQALIECPEDPLKSPCAYSFLAAYRSSSAVLEITRSRLKVFPVTGALLWAHWIVAFSATVVFGTIVARGPRSTLARLALIEFDKAHQMFEEAAKYNIRAAMAFSALERLRKKALWALDKAQGIGSQWTIGEEDTHDELFVLSGKTRLFDSKSPQKQPDIHALATQNQLTESGWPRFQSPSSQLDPTYSLYQSGNGQWGPSPLDPSGMDTRWLSAQHQPINNEVIETLPVLPSMYSGQAFDFGSRAQPSSTERGLTNALPVVYNASYQPVYFPSPETVLPTQPFPSLGKNFQPENTTAEKYPLQEILAPQNYAHQEAQDHQWPFPGSQFANPAPSVDYQHQHEENWLADIGLAFNHSALGQQWETFLLRDSGLSEETSLLASW